MKEQEQSEFLIHATWLGERLEKGNEMSHPPIPPNCKYFDWNSEDDEFDFLHPPEFGGKILRIGLEGKGSQLDPWKESTYGGFKKLIACVARCAWLDEAENISAMTTHEMEDQGCDLGNHQSALNFANAWKEWGDTRRPMTEQERGEV